MRHLLLFLLAVWSLVHLQTGILYGQTVVRNSITTNTTWTKAGSPYQINGGITVSSNVTLTIAPGVEVQFNGGGLYV
ncbi:hypothetical protein, partial [uncultured Fibrella sp.]|uniref:hypothetical protein n=1 Tax=uncultured Fibrella sp. TaxID=1284596 RepID=UPI0035CA53AA